MWSTIHYDYMAAYLDFFNDAPTVARTVAAHYTSYPVAGWSKKFAALAAQLAELDGDNSAPQQLVTEGGDLASRDARMHAAASLEPVLSISTSGTNVVLEYVVWASNTGVHVRVAIHVTHSK